MRRRRHKTFRFLRGRKSKSQNSKRKPINKSFHWACQITFRIKSNNSSLETVRCRFNSKEICGYFLPWRWATLHALCCMQQLLLSALLVKILNKQQQRLPTKIKSSSILPHFSSKINWFFVFLSVSNAKKKKRKVITDLKRTECGNRLIQCEFLLKRILCDVLSVLTEIRKLLGFLKLTWEQERF